MSNWQKIIASKTNLAQKNIETGMKPGKLSADVRIQQGQSRVTNFPVLDMGVRPSIDTPRGR